MALIVNPFWGFSGSEDNAPRLNGLYFEIPLTTESSDLYHYWPNDESSIRIVQVMASGGSQKKVSSVPISPIFGQVGNLAVSALLPKQMNLLS